ncbi:hypothetical protein B0H13DRAFT_2326782 [Mycena leptocephala]|nr:hypothetical protein B0H13DRAFT_2326782 [Mycena leptocephala]
MTRVDDMGDKSLKTRNLPFRVFKHSRSQTEPRSLVLYFHHLAKSPSPLIFSSCLFTRACIWGVPNVAHILAGDDWVSRTEPLQRLQRPTVTWQGEQLVGGCTCGFSLAIYLESWGGRDTSRAQASTRSMTPEGTLGTAQMPPFPSNFTRIPWTPHVGAVYP